MVQPLNILKNKIEELPNNIEAEQSVLGSILISNEIFDEMLSGLRDYISQNDEITVGDFRDLYQTSRKYALAVLDYLDQQQITRRVGDARVLRD